MGRGTLLIKAAKTDWSALNVAQQTACNQLAAAVASATQALQKFQASDDTRPLVLGREGPDTQKV